MHLVEDIRNALDFIENHPLNKVMGDKVIKPPGRSSQTQVQVRVQQVEIQRFGKRVFQPSGFPHSTWAK
jgi:hypothetical protein